jgi:hypothetical protein
VDEAENIAELGDVDPANIVKISGSRAACLAALEELKVRTNSLPRFVAD